MNTARFLGAVFAFTLHGMVFACVREPQPMAADPRPGAPAYWESELPRDPARSDGGAPEAMPGTSDPFLWSHEAAPPAPPEAQTPLRSHAPREDASAIDSDD